MSERIGASAGTRPACLSDVVEFARRTLGGSVAPETPTVLAATGLPAARVAAPRVGIETEWFVVDLATPLLAVPPDRTRAALADRLGERRDTETGDPVLPGGSKLTFEPGGQLELSGAPLGLGEAVAATEADLSLVRAALVDAGLGLAAMGTDPLRPSRRLLTAPRYAAMERFFSDAGFRTGPAMMCSTASVQVNVDSGDPEGTVARWRLAHRLGPVLVAMFAASPMLAGRRTGWASSRQAIWADLDPSRSRPVLPPDGPADPDGQLGPDHPLDQVGALDRERPLDLEGLYQAWAEYLLAARVMLVREPGGQFRPGLGGVTFADWLADRADFGRPPSLADLAYHATTVFPPVRPRGWLELRYLDAQPFGLWPVAVAVTVGLLDDPVAARTAADACRVAADRWTAAAMLGLRDPVLRQAAAVVVQAARAGAARLGASVELLASIDAFAEQYVAAGRSPADELNRRLADLGPTGLLRQEASSCVPSLS